MSTGELLPCSAEAVTAELPGTHLNLSSLTPSRRRSSRGHHFWEEHEETSVSVDQFSSALGSAFVRVGFDVVFDEDPQINLRVEETDMARLARETSGQQYELFSSSDYGSKCEAAFANRPT